MYKWELVLLAFSHPGANDIDIIIMYVLTTTYTQTDAKLCQRANVFSKYILVWSIQEMYSSIASKESFFL